MGFRRVSSWRIGMLWSWRLSAVGAVFALGCQNTGKDWAARAALNQASLPLSEVGLKVIDATIGVPGSRPISLDDEPPGFQVSGANPEWQIEGFAESTSWSGSVDVSGTAYSDGEDYGFDLEVVFAEVTLTDHDSTYDGTMLYELRGRSFDSEFDGEHTWIGDLQFGGKLQGEVSISTLWLMNWGDANYLCEISGTVNDYDAAEFEQSNYYCW